MSWPDLVAMVVALVPVVVSPGASLSLLLVEVAAGNRHGPRQVATGTALGASTIAIALGVIGLGNLVVQSPVVLSVFALVGGLMLVALGLRTLLSRRVGWSTPRRRPGALRSAYLTVITNPKALAVYLFVAPQTLPAHAATIGYLSFAAVHALLIFSWLPTFGAGVRRVPALTTSPRWRLRLGVANGAYLILLGVGLWIAELR